MTTSPSESRKDAPELPKQHNFEDAARRALDVIAGQTEEQLRWLGAEPENGGCTVPVLEDRLSVDFTDGIVRNAAGDEAARHWRILTLHYLGVSVRPEAMPTSVCFADLSVARSYAPVYQGRVISRLCHTAGRDRETLEKAALALNGEPVDAGDLAFDFQIYPRVRLRLVWHAADEEFPPGATVLLPPNIESYFSVEDIVVLSEGLVARLGGRPF